MLQNKKGMSEIILTVIMVGLVLVAIGIVWVVISGVLTKQTETVDYSQKCTGLIFSATGVKCDPASTNADCNVTVKRGLGSKGDSINGVEVTWINSTTSLVKTYPGNIAAETKLIKSDGAINATRVDLRVYYTKTDGSSYFCPVVFTST